MPTRTITADGVGFAYRELGANNPGPPVVFLIHLAAVLDNWDPRVVDGLAPRGVPFFIGADASVGVKVNSRSRVGLIVIGVFAMFVSPRSKTCAER